jgi:hypothetical protein
MGINNAIRLEGYRLDEEQAARAALMLEDVYKK